MSPPPATVDQDGVRLHASAVAWCGRGVLLRGRSGSGKSALSARMLAAGAWLVADDLVRLSRRRGALYAASVAADGLIELRGSGIFHVATMQGVRLGLCVDLQSGPEGERLPVRVHASFLDLDLPLLVVDGHDPAAVARILVALTAARVH